MIFWVYYIFGGEIFYVSFERLFCFYTPPHILKAFRTAIKRIDDLAFGFYANRPWAEDWKIRFKPPQSDRKSVV